KKHIKKTILIDNNSCYLFNVVNNKFLLDIILVNLIFFNCESSIYNSFIGFLKLELGGFDFIKNSESRLVCFLDSLRKDFIDLFCYSSFFMVLFNDYFDSKFFRYFLIRFYFYAGRGEKKNISYYRKLLFL